MFVGLLARLAFGLGYWVDKPLTHDETEYLALARNLAAGRGFGYDTPEATSEGTTTQRFGRAPLYPLFLAVVARPALLDGDSTPRETPVSVKVAQSIVGAVEVGLIAAIAARAAGGTAGVAAAWLAAVHPPLVWICAYALSESLYSALALATVLLLGRVTDAGPQHRDGGATLRTVGAAGLVAGLATLTRPAMLFFFPLAGTWIARRARPALAVTFLLGATLVIAPWTIRNGLTYGRLILVASEGGVTFWTGNHPLARGEGDQAANPEIKRANQQFLARHPGLSPEALEPIYYREAFAYVLEHPLWWMGLLLRKLFYLVVPIGPSYTLHSTRYLVASLVAYLGLLPFAILGCIHLARLSRTPRSLWLLAGSAVLASLVFLPQERFRIPVLDPTLIIAAAGWWALRAAPARAEESMDSGIDGAP